MSDMIQKAVGRIHPQDAAWRAKATERISRLTMPHWALGRLLDLAVDVAGMTHSLNPSTSRKTVVVMAGDHGVTDEGVSAFPKNVTGQMVANFAGGGAAINVLARHAGARVVVVDCGVAADLTTLKEAGLVIDKRIAAGTDNMAVGPAMSRAQAVRSVEVGLEVAAALSAGTDFFATGDMGIGNTTPSSALVSAICRAHPELVTGCGTGIDEAARRKKAAVIEKSMTKNKPDVSDPFDLLAKVGGFEIGAIAGLILGAAADSKPVLIDGFISTAGALVAQAICPASVEYMIAAHQSVERGHVMALKHLGKTPLLDLGMRLGEGSGAALAFPIVDAALRILNEMATFDAAGVSESTR